MATPPLTKCMTCESHLGATPVASKCARTEEIGERGISFDQVLILKRPHESIHFLLRTG